MKAIASAANAQFKHWRRIAESPRYMYAQGLSLAEGAHLAQASLDSRRPVAAALVRRGATGAALEACLARLDDGLVYELAPPLFDALSPVEHGVGLILVIAIDRPDGPHLLDGDAVFLDGVQDPGNVGAVLRVAAAADVANVFASPTTAALWSAKSLRAGQGAHFRLRIVEDVAVDRLSAWFAGPWIGTATRDAGSLWQANLPSRPLGWMLGSEGAGLSGPASAQCSQFVSIPVARGIESLNVATAAAVCLFERQRRRVA